MAAVQHKIHTGATTRTERVIATPTGFAQNNYLYVQEVGTLKSLSPHVAARQNLDSYLLLIVLSGEGTVTYQGEEFPMSFGSCAFIDCKKKYSHISSREKPWELMWVHFNGRSAASIYQQFTRSNPKGIFRCSSVFYYKKAMEEMLNLHLNRSKSAEMLSNKYITDLVTQGFLDSASDEEGQVESLQTKLQQVKTYLDEHFTEKILLEDLEERFYVSRFHLSREFKKSYETTIGNYLLNLRIGRAKELLRFSDKPIEEIASDCGIKDTSYFTKVFRKSEQMTALEYRHLWGSVV